LHRNRSTFEQRIYFWVAGNSGALGIIFIGVREFLYPAVGALGFGLLLLAPRDADFLGGVSDGSMDSYRSTRT
jgi:hypothetical protein